MDRRNRVKSRYSVGTSGFVFVSISVLITATAFITQANMLFWGIGILFGALITSILWIFLAMRGLTIDRIMPAQCVCGQSTRLRYQVCFTRQLFPVINSVLFETWDTMKPFLRKPVKGPLTESPQRLKVRPHGWLVSLNNRRKTSLELELKPQRRGVLTFDRICLSSGFPFGIIRKSMAITSKDRLIVTPREFKLKTELFRQMRGNDLTSQLSQNRSGHGDEFFGLRPYRSGDRLRSVDWKRSARANSLVIREMAQNLPPRIVIELRLTHSQPVPPELIEKIKSISGLTRLDDLFDMRELAISLVASIASMGIQKGNQVGLIIQDLGGNAAQRDQKDMQDAQVHNGLAGLMPGTGNAHYHKIVRTLSLFDAPEREAAEGLLDHLKPGALRPTIRVTDSGYAVEKQDGVFELTAVQLLEHIDTAGWRGGEALGTSTRHVGASQTSAKEMRFAAEASA